MESYNMWPFVSHCFPAASRSPVTSGLQAGKFSGQSPSLIPLSCQWRGIRRVTSSLKCCPCELGHLSRTPYSPEFPPTSQITLLSLSCLFLLVSPTTSQMLESVFPLSSVVALVILSRVVAVNTMYVLTTPTLTGQAASLHLHSDTR